MATAPAKDEKKVEKEESDEDMGFGLFDQSNSLLFILVITNKTFQFHF